MNILEVFGTNVRKYRTQFGLSQEKFAEKCGLHRTYISDIECFRRSISLDNIQKIADALETETYKLFVEEKIMKSDHKKIKDILEEHYGKDNAIASHCISKRMGYPMEATQAVSRKAIHETAEEYNLPLLSCEKGFYLAETEAELNEYNQNIDNRISEMNRRRELANKNFRRKHNDN